MHPGQPPINPQSTPDPPLTHPRPIPNQRPIIYIPDIVQSFKGVRDALDGGSKQQGEPHQCVARRKAHVRAPKMEMKVRVRVNQCNQCVAGRKAHVRAPKMEMKVRVRVGVGVEG